MLRNNGKDWQQSSDYNNIAWEEKLSWKSGFDFVASSAILATFLKDFPPQRNQKRSIVLTLPYIIYMPTNKLLAIVSMAFGMALVIQPVLCQECLKSI